MASVGYNIYISHDAVKNIEIATYGQADNNLWFALCNGRLTSSRFGEIMHHCESTNSRRLVKDIMGYGEQMQHVAPQIRWDQNNEEVAHKHYVENWKANNGEHMNVEQTGLYLLPEKSYLGASSDGKVFCSNLDTYCVGCIEIKCSYSIDGCVTVELDPDEIERKYGRKFFMHRGEDGFLHLPHTHPYFP